LQENGALSLTSGLTDYYGTLNLDNSGNPISDISRINASASIFLQGATVVYTGYNAGSSAQSLGAVFAAARRVCDHGPRAALAVRLR